LIVTAAFDAVMANVEAELGDITGKFCDIVMVVVLPKLKSIVEHEPLLKL
jgi:hypothetical protein